MTHNRIEDTYSFIETALCVCVGGGVVYPIEVHILIFTLC